MSCGVWTSTPPWSSLLPALRTDRFTSGIQTPINPSGARPLRWLVSKDKSLNIQFCRQNVSTPLCAPGSREMCWFPSERGCYSCGDHDWKVGYLLIFNLLAEYTSCFLLRQRNMCNIKHNTTVIVLCLYFLGGWCWMLTPTILFLCTRMAMRSFPMSNILQVKYQQDKSIKHSREWHRQLSCSNSTEFKSWPFLWI